MQHSKIKHINSLWKNCPIIGEFYAKIEQLKQLSQHITKLLPPELVDHCCVANLKNGTLTLTVNGPAWKYKVNFIKMDLLEQLRQNPLWSGIIAISVKIDYLVEELDVYLDNHHKDLNHASYKNNITFPQQTSRKHFTISANNALLINNIIEEDIHDLRLKQTFKHFVQKNLEYIN